jgi:hypothetical protein
MVCETESLDLYEYYPAGARFFAPHGAVVNEELTVRSEGGRRSQNQLVFMIDS